MIVRDHFVAVSRIQGRMTKAARFILISDPPKVVFGAVGALVGGLAGLVIGGLLISIVEALVMAPMVYRAAMPHRMARPEGGGL